MAAFVEYLHRHLHLPPHAAGWVTSLRQRPLKRAGPVVPPPLEREGA
ncbi:MAG: hypothetical protein AB7I13_16325 [Vicinamibacterales bacterium]